MRMRTIDQAAAYIAEQDPGTALTKTALRRLVVTGTVPSVRVGQKYLVALENLDAFLAGQETPGDTHTEPGRIRPVRTVGR